MKKQIGFKTKGMNRDLSVSAFNPEFAFENMNLRLSTNENNTLMSWVNEKGTSLISLSDSDNNQVTLNGCVIGTAILNKYLVLFLTNGCVATEGNVQYFDSIYRLEYKSGDDARITMTATKLYDGLEKGNLGFSIEHPLETIVSYESDSIQKVYWTDGINQPRLINIAPKINNEGQEVMPEYNDTSFDFIPTLKLEETIKVQKVLGGGGMFAPGVIQYAFTYYRKYGQESNIFYTTPLYYISHADRGASPEDKVDNIFRITIENVDTTNNFDYLRIYSIQRTSINGTPICKRIQDIALDGLTDDKASYTDTGLNGNAVDPMELLYIGGVDILAGTMEQKDNTLFLGDITLSKRTIPDTTITVLNTENELESREIKDTVELTTSTRSFCPQIVSMDTYEYANQLTSFKKDSNGKTDESVPCAGFKYGNYYRCGVQFQDKTGKWTDPVFIKDVEIEGDNRPDINSKLAPSPIGEDDLPITVKIENSSNNPITPTRKIYIAVQKDSTNYKLEIELITSAGTIESGNEATIGAKITHGKNYIGANFCDSTEDAWKQELGMSTNVQLQDTGGSFENYGMSNVAYGITIGHEGQTFEFNCLTSPSEEPGEDFEDLLTAMGAVIGEDLSNASTTKSYLKNCYDMAKAEMENNTHGLFNASNYPEVYGDSSYRGNNEQYKSDNTCYNAMQAWLMAMCLSEIVPTSGNTTNNQTKLFAKAYELGGGRNVPLYGSYSVEGDVMIARLVAGAIYAINHDSYKSQIPTMREELQGSAISGSSADYTHTEIAEWVGTTKYRLGYEMTNLGYFVNTDSFLPSAPGVRVSEEVNNKKCLVNDKPLPSTQGQGEPPFNSSTNNYLVDESIHATMIQEYNMMAQTSLETWQNYSSEKKQRLIQVGATPRCTPVYMFGARKKVKLHLENGQLPEVDGYNRYVFEETEDDTGLYIDGPFSMLGDKNLYPQINTTMDIVNTPCGYNDYDPTDPNNYYYQVMNDIESQKTPVQKYIEAVLSLADDSRYPTQDTNYGRRRPGCGNTIEGTEYNSNHGSSENEIYNIDLSCIVAENNYQVEHNEGGSLTGWKHDDGFSADRPNSYVSGHSSQIWTMAMLLGQIDTGNITSYMRGAYQFSVNRSIGRFHWMSDVIYGRLFGTMILPIINAMEGLQSGYADLKRAVGGGNYPYDSTVSIKLKIHNSTSDPVSINNEAKFYIANPDVDGNLYGNNRTYDGYRNVYPSSGRYILESAPSVINIPSGGTTDEYSITISTEPGTNLAWLAYRGFAPDECISQVEDIISNVFLYKTDGSGEDISYNTNIKPGFISGSEKCYVNIIDGRCSGNKECVKIVEGGVYTVDIVYKSASLSRGLVRSSSRQEETGVKNSSQENATATSQATTGEVAVTVPVIKGKIPSKLADKLIGQGYIKARAVVVYPEMHDRKVICQGVGNPTLFTRNHRGEGTESTSDMYAQSSWFFRPKNTGMTSGTEYSEDVNAPISSDAIAIQYQDSADNPQYIKRTEIQGYFNSDNKFRNDWSTLTFHSPDIDFDATMATVDYRSKIQYSHVGNASFVRTLSDIDIQTETPAISGKGSGFIKKAFTGNYAKGIISGLFWDDYVVEDYNEDDEKAFRPDQYEDVSVKWLVYLWNRTGSLNNDTTRPANKGVSTAVLKKKIISNLRFAETTWSKNEDQKDYTVNASSLFNSDEPTILKLQTNDSNLSNIYMGNIDTILTSDYEDGMYFSSYGRNATQSPEFVKDVIWKTYNNDSDANDTGLFNWMKEGNLYMWKKNWEGKIGDVYKDVVRKKAFVRMKYKTTPHLVMVKSGFQYSELTEDMQLPIFELKNEITLEDSTLFGGTTQDALRENVWIPCGEPVRLDDLTHIIPEEGDPYDVVCFEYSYGDTYYQRWDCLKTYAFTPEDINQVVEIGSFMLETYVNIDGRYDRNRGQLSNLYMSPQNFNLLNPVYSQLNNFFSYRIQDEDANKEKHFPNQITWSKTKTSGADVDLWTNVTLASVLELDGDKGKVRRFARFNDKLLCFQDTAVAQILYNENTMLSTTEGVPVEIANSGKVQGKGYISDSIGCSNKWSVCSTPSGIYFMDSYNKAIFMYNGQLNNLSSSYGMNALCKDNIPDDSVIWTPSDYMIDNGTAGEERIFGFQNFVTYYDKLNQDVLFINKEKAFAFSEKIGTFTSFYNYEESPYFCNLQDTGIWLKVAVEEEGDIDIPDHLEYTTSLWKHQAGSYCKFFGENKPYWMILVGNPEPQLDKIFTNLEFRACVDGDGEMETIIPEGRTEPVETGRFIPALPFTDLETWNEYQHGKATLSNKWGHAAFMHPRNGDFSLKRKFRIWRCDIPRSNAPLTADAGLNCYRKEYRPNDRMRNPWLYLKLMKQAAASNKVMDRAEIHDVIMTYFG